MARVIGRAGCGWRLHWPRMQFFLAFLLILSVVLVPSHLGYSAPAPSINGRCDPGGCGSGFPCTFSFYIDGSTYLAAKCQGGGNSYQGTTFSTVFQSVVADVACNVGCNLFFSQGTYSVTTSLLINQRQAITLTGAGSGYSIDYAVTNPAATRFLAASVFSPMLNITGVGPVGAREQGVTVQAITFEGSASCVGQTCDGIWVGPSDLAHFVNVVSRRFDRCLVFAALGGNGPDSPTVALSSFQNCGEGVTILGGTSFPRIANNIFADNVRYGLAINGANSGAADSNLFFHGGSGGTGAGVYVANANKFTFTGNNFQQNYDVGVFITSTSTNIVFTGNIFAVTTTPNTNGILLYISGAANVTVVGNTFLDDGAPSLTKYGVYTTGASTNPIIDANYFRGTFLTAPINLNGITSAIGQTNRGYNPVGKLTNFVNGAFIGPCGTGTTVVSTTVYVICVTDLVWGCTGGTVSSIVEKDNLGNQIFSVANCTALPATDVYTPQGYSITFTFTVLPTVSVFAN